jgi:hypothetical protein
MDADQASNCDDECLCRSARLLIQIPGMAREFKFAPRPAYKFRHGISIKNRVRLYLGGYFLVPITRSSPSDQELILYSSLLLRS